MNFKLNIYRNHHWVDENTIYRISMVENIYQKLLQHTRRMRVILLNVTKHKKISASPMLRLLI